MNIQDRDKQRLNGRQRQVKLHPKALQMPLGNAVPKHKITINNQRRTNVQRAAQLNDLFPKADLDPTGEDYHEDKDFFGSLANDLLKMMAANSEEDENEEAIPDQEIAHHVLTPIVNDWGKSFRGIKAITVSRNYVCPMKRFIRFLVREEIPNPTAEDAKYFLNRIVATKRFPVQQMYMLSMDAFFFWAGTNGKYENIVRGLELTKIDGKPDKDSRQIVDNTEMVDSQKVLKNALNVWIGTLNKDDLTKVKYKSEILNLILFLNLKNVKIPTLDDIVEYYNYGFAKKSTTTREEGLEIIYYFFDWAYKNNQYPKNIFPNNNATPQQNIAELKNDAVLIHSMRKAGFNQVNIVALLNNELKIFKDWLTSSPQNMKFIDYIFKFAHFLYEGGAVITAPTQETIIDYYTKHLNQFVGGVINKYILSIKYFFQWTAEQKRYPNIAINIVGVPYREKQCYDIPILNQELILEHIPHATRPLISNIK